MSGRVAPAEAFNLMGRKLLPALYPIECAPQMSCAARVRRRLTSGRRPQAPSHRGGIDRADAMARRFRAREVKVASSPCDATTSLSCRPFTATSRGAGARLASHRTGPLSSSKARVCSLTAARAVTGQAIIVDAGEYRPGNRHPDCRLMTWTIPAEAVTGIFPTFRTLRLLGHQSG